MSNTTSRTFLSLAIFVAATGFVMPQQAKADTFIVSGWDGPHLNALVFSVGVDKSVYKPGERVIATAESLYLPCSNYNFATVKATINGATQTVLNIYGGSGSASFTAQSTSGNYFAVFTGTAVRERDRRTLISADAALTTPLVATMSIPYTVSAVTGGTTGGTNTGGPIPGGTNTGGSTVGGNVAGGAITGTTITGGTITGTTITGGVISGGLPTPTPTPPPTVSISATPNRVIAGNETTVSWNASNVTSCSVTKNGAPWQTVLSDPNTRTQFKSFVETINVQTTYVVTCANGASQNVASAIVNVTSVFQGF